MMALNRENVIRAAEKYVSKGKLEAAIKEYRKVLAENPNDANTLNRVGDLYARIERFGEAVKLFSQIAEQYTRDGFFVKAIAIYKKIIKLDPTSLTVYERLAELYHKQGLLNEARTQYQVLADYYQKHDNAASAITIYQRMAELEPDNPSFHLKLAELFESQRLIDKALKEYRLLADLLIVGGSVDEAAQVYLKALEVSSEDLDFVRDAVSGLHD
ncbi:MAG: tetratricopeptide repeat protein, partial [Acidobacteriota bacterium]